MTIKKLFDYLPSYPHHKMNIFSGTNTKEEVKKVLTLLQSSEITTENALKAYKKLLTKKLQTKNIYTFASGRMGFYSILKTINIQKGDEIIIPSFTCVVVPNAIIYAGAIPVYCDINKDDFNIDTNQIEALITPKTRVLYAQHTFGQMCDITKLNEIAKKYNLLVVEDTALALGAKIDGKYAGTLGDFGYFSTDRSKVINTGLGGIVSINNQKYLKLFDDYYKQLPHLDTNHAKKIARTFILNIATLHPSVYWFGKFLNAILSKTGIMTYFLDEHIHDFSKLQNYPYPAKLSNIFAEIGISQMQNLENNISHRRDVANYYNTILNIYSENYMKNEANIFLRYSFLIKNRDYWEEKFSSKIDLSIWFKTIASGKQNNFEEIGYKEGSNSISEYVCQHIFNLPTHQKIDPAKLKTLLVELKNSGDIITKESIL